MEQQTDHPETPGDLERAEQDQMIAGNLSRIRRKILVMSGKGGVGKSTVAAYLALRLSDAGHRVGLMDVDLHGPSIPRLLNIQGGLDLGEPGVVKPYRCSDTLAVVSVEMLMGDRDAAVIWRGPMKIGAIRQFISDVRWGDLDYLLVDAPPGTGDEPLTVAQNIPDAEALLVTTPQEISVADVRKSINFCREAGLRILGVVENMSAMSCPHCGEEILLFGEGGGEKMAHQMGVDLLARIPVDHRMVEAADQGRLGALLDQAELGLNQAYDQITQCLVEEKEF
jgi:Mrp family chromosome partitioning ATPase